ETGLVVAKIVDQRGDHFRAGGEQPDRVTVRVRAHHLLHADSAGTTGQVLHHDVDTEFRGHGLGNDPRDRVGVAASAVRDDPGDRVTREVSAILGTATAAAGGKGEGSSESDGQAYAPTKGHSGLLGSARRVREGTTLCRNRT